MKLLGTLPIAPQPKLSSEALQITYLDQKPERTNFNTLCSEYQVGIYFQFHTTQKWADELSKR